MYGFPNSVLSFRWLRTLKQEKWTIVKFFVTGNFTFQEGKDSQEKSWVKKSSIKNPGGSTPEIEVFEMMVSKGARSKNHKRVSVLDGGSLDGRVWKLETERFCGLLEFHIKIIKLSQIRHRVEITA